MSGAGAAPAVPHRGSRHRRLFTIALASIAALSWLTLWAWARSPYGRYLEHGDWTASGPAAALCRAIPGGDWLLPITLYAAAWVLMTAAMMLPTIVPLVDVFDRMVRDRADRASLLARLALGYVAVWAGFGAVAHALHALLLDAVAASPMLARHGHWIGIGVIACAGAFQFTALKHRCLDKCRTPLGFVMERWRGRAPRREAFALGIRHGLFCVGCCWALMLLMFAVGAGSLGWMLVLAAAMAIEKNLPWGRRLSTPLGIALLAWAAALALAAP